MMFFGIPAKKWTKKLSPKPHVHYYIFETYSSPLRKIAIKQDLYYTCKILCKNGKNLNSDFH